MTSAWSIFFFILILTITWYKTHTLYPEKSLTDNHYFVYLKTNLNFCILGIIFITVFGGYFNYRFKDDFWQNSFNIKVAALIISGVLATTGLLMIIVFGLSNIFCTKIPLERRKAKYIQQKTEQT